MGFFSSSHNSVRYGALIDIGSGSVLTALVASDPAKTYPDIIWSTREYTPLRKSASVSDSAKGVMTSLMNALMSLDGAGRKALFEATNQQKIHHLQVTVAAPWSYTATKTISYQNEEPFEVTDTLIAELLRTAEQKVSEEMQEQEKVNELGLTVVARTTMQVIANGYPIRVTNKQKAETVKVIQANAVVQKYLIDAVADAHDKILPEASISQYSFILPYYFVLTDLIEGVNEFCIVDITYEATELGIVRDGILTYTTHTPYGAFSLARELAEVLGVPLDEAYGYLSCEDLSCFVMNTGDEKREEIDAIIEAYRTKLSELFTETGDSLAIPKKIYLHANFSTEEFFATQILAGAAMATRMQHATYNVTHELLTKKYDEAAKAALFEKQGDTALLISAQFFHTKEHHMKFEQL